MPDLDSLRCFIAAAERLNFRAASKAVALSPAAFSDRIKRLEEDLGAQLFDRTSRRVGLTAAGHRLLPHARQTLAEAAACRLAVDAEGDAPVVLTLGTRFELGLSWVLPALEALAVEHPAWTVHLLFGDTPALLEALRRGDADAIIGSMRLVDPGLATRPLHEEAYVFVGAPALLDRDPLDGVADAPRHSLVDISGDLPLFRYWRDQAPPEEAWSFAAIRHLGTIGAIRAWIVAGHGVGVLPAYFVDADLRVGRLREILPQVRAGSDWFRLVWRARHPDEAALVQLARSLKDRPLR
jgi:DNA-binding transcriptional LysR family regulator